MTNAPRNTPARNTPARNVDEGQRVLALGVLAAVLAALLTACGSPSPAPVPASAPATTAPGSARAFLDAYVDPDGRVVRRDQGGDTVSEGQAYALLLDFAVGDRSQFAAVWGWSEHNLGQPDGLLAYHWQHGGVADRNPASDADLDIARALILAGTAWHLTAYLTAGRAYAAAILTAETVSAAGTTWLVAGPWARRAPFALDPSYADPATFQLLERTTGDPRWTQIATSSATATSEDTARGTRLPSDWAQLSSAGQVHVSGPPGGGPARYGYDAFRTLVRQVDDCVNGPGRGFVAGLLPLATRTASPSDRADTYNTDATPAQPGANPLVLVAAAGSAEAAGQPTVRDGFLAQAAEAAARGPSYYLDAWVALGRYLLTTKTLSGCSA